MIEEFIHCGEGHFEVKDPFKAIWRIRHLPKGAVIHRQGSSTYKTFIVLSGIARSYMYKNGKEITTYFAVDFMPILGIDAFQTPRAQSAYTIEVLEDSIIAEASLDKFHQCLEEDKTLCSKYVKALEQEYMQLALNQISSRFTTARERYQRFSKAFPQVMQKVKLTHIASYLDISLETLSRGRTKWDRPSKEYPRTPKIH